MSSFPEGTTQSEAVEVDLKVSDDQPLPYGWTKGVNGHGRVYYKNNITREIQNKVPLNRARPKPKQKKPIAKGEGASTTDEPQKEAPKYSPSPGSRRCIRNCVGRPYKIQYNAQYSNFNNKSSNCKSFCGSIGYNTMSTIQDGCFGWCLCWMILLPLALLMDIINLFVAVFLYVPPCCCGCCLYASEGGRVGFCCLGTFVLRTSFLCIGCVDGQCGSGSGSGGKVRYKVDTNIYAGALTL